MSIAQIIEPYRAAPEFGVNSSEPLAFWRRNDSANHTFRVIPPFPHYLSRAEIPQAHWIISSRKGLPAMSWPSITAATTVSRHNGGAVRRERKLRDSCSAITECPLGGHIPHMLIDVWYWLILFNLGIMRRPLL